MDLILKRNTTTNKERSAAHSKQVLIALRLYATGTFQRVNYLRAACTIIHKVSRAISEQKGQLLSPPGNLAAEDVAYFLLFYFFLTFHFQPHSWSWLRSRLISQRLGFWEQNLVKIFSYSFAFSCYSLCFPLLESLYPVRPLNVVLHVADMITVWKFTYEITPQTMHFLAIDSRKHCSVAFQKWNFKHRLDVVYRDHV